MLLAEGTIVNALVARHAVVVALMKTVLYTKQVTGGTSRFAEFDAGTEIYHCAIEGSA